MLGKNELLLNAINKPEFIQKGDAASQALDDIIAVDLTDPIKLRVAVTKHRALWEQMGIKPDSVHIPWQDTKPKGLGAGGTDDDAYLTDQTFLNTGHTTTFEKIKQAATEQRVKLGLSANTDQDVLLKILKYNEDECRAYLMNKTALPDIPTPQDWHPNTPNPGHPDKNDSTHILPDDSVKRIQKHAAQQLLLKFINKPDFNDVGKLDALLNAKRLPDLVALNLAAQAIGIDATVSPSLDALDVFDVELLKKIEDRRDALNQAAALTEFNRIKDTIKDDWLSTRAGLLSHASPEAFLDALLNEPEFATVDKAAFNKVDNRAAFAETLQKQFCERYLQDNLAKNGIKIPADMEKARKVLNADEATFRAELQAALPGHDVIINKGVKAENQAALKFTLLKSIIAQQPPSALADLKGVDKAASKDFATKLANFLKPDATGKKVSLDFLKPEQLEELKGLVHDRVQTFSRDKRVQDFSNIVESIPSGYGKNGHKALIDFFRQLPDEKQAELLLKQNVNQIKLLMSAKTPEQVKGILGKIESLDVNPLVEENKKNALFKTIHNPHVARTLINLNIPADKIAAVNAVLDRGLVITNATEYKDFIDALHVACGSPDKNTFYNAFNLNPAGALTSPVKIANLIAAHHTSNAIVYQRRAESTLPAEKRFEDILLSVGRPAAWTSKDDVKNAETLFAQSKDVHEFLDKLFPVAKGQSLSTKDQALKEALSRELTPTIFREIQAEKRANIFAKTDSHKERMIDEINQQLTELQKSNESIEKHAKKTEKLHTVEQLQARFSLYDPSLNKKTAEYLRELKKEYEELSAQCGDTIAYLKSKLADIEACLESTKGSAPTDPEIKRKYEEMRKNLEGERILVNEQLAIYQNAQRKLNGEKGLLATLKEFASGTQRLQHKSANATYKAVSRGELASLATQTNSGVRTSPIASISANRDFNYTSEKIPPSGQVLCVDVVDYKPDPSDPNKKIAGESGRFTIDFHPENADRSENLIHHYFSKDEVQKHHPLKVEVVSVPSDPNLHAKQSIETAINLLEHWDGKTPIKLMGDKGSDEEVQFLYYAILEVGEHYPGFDKSKVVMDKDYAAAWKPSQDKNWRGNYDPESIREKVYKGSAKDIIKAQLRDFDVLMENRQGETLASAAKGSTSVFKGRLQEGMTDDIRTKVKKDEVVEPRDGPELTG